MSKHTCHWTGCRLEVPPAMWVCKQHWFKLPKRLRDKIWATCPLGQEITKTPSDEYMTVLIEVEHWIAESLCKTVWGCVMTTRKEVLEVADRIGHYMGTLDVEVLLHKYTATLPPDKCAVMSEKVEWTARISKLDPDKVIIDSDDFEHDAMLSVLGDFESVQQKLEYAKGLAEKLNKQEIES